MARHIPILSVLALALWPGLAGATDTVLSAVPASEVTQADLVYVKRPVIVFADTPNDPAFLRQMDLLERYHADLAERDVILITDTDPATPSPLRKALRPRGFSLVLMDKDWRPSIRKPLPWDGREVTRAIDKMPMAREEALQRHPGR